MLKIEAKGPDNTLRLLKIEAKGPDNTLRLRQVKVLGYIDTPLMQKQPRAASIQQKNCEAETLRVFRLITSQVFGRLLENHHDEPAVGAAASEASALASAASTASAVASAAIGEQPPSGNVIVDEPYLKEHVVGILFSRSKLTHLQKQVCSHIVTAIKKESIRLKDDWEIHLCSGGLENAADPS